MNEPIRCLQSRYVLLPTENIDTDQILPARFLLVTTREGLGAHLFADWRRDAEGRPRPEFPLSSPEAQGAQVLVAGRNFGCGSSREHAAWALRDHGFRAVVSTGIADIFRRNAIRNGIVPVDLAPEAHAALVASAGGSVVVDLGSRTLTLPDGTRAPFPLEPFARYCLMEGIDELGFLLAQEHAIASHEARWGSAFSTHHPNPMATATPTKTLP